MVIVLGKAHGLALQPGRVNKTRVMQPLNHKDFIILSFFLVDFTHLFLHSILYHRPALARSLRDVGFGQGNFKETDLLECRINTGLDFTITDHKAALLVARNKHQPFLGAGVQLQWPSAEISRENRVRTLFR